MKNILLLGAGFSRNWGGFLAVEAFEYLLGCPEIVKSQRLKELLWQSQQTGGFENALAELQDKFTINPDEHRNDLVDFQNAVTRMFNDMNSGFFENHNFEFQQFKNRMVKEFLTKFDIIFTLNQDLLLEHHYIDSNVSLLSNQRWSGSELPGMRPISDPNIQSWAKRTWAPKEPKDFRLDKGFQPYIKLHGSSNWRQDKTQSTPMLIMGGNKVLEIELFPVLSWYQKIFNNCLSESGTRLMIIGYGFRDIHINEVIEGAVNKHDLKIFVISPTGGDQLEESFKRGLIGASRRPLNEIFGNDTIEHNKVMRFFGT